MLFYAVVAFALILKGADTIMIVLAWLFVLTRLAARRDPYRAQQGALALRRPSRVGVLIIAIMWIKLFLHVLSAGLA